MEASEHSLMPPMQGHSTETALLKVISDIIDAVDCQVTLLGLLDMSATFDTVDHEILLHRMEVSFVVSGQALKWLSSFLTDILQSVAFGGSISTPQRLLCGVPQVHCARSTADRALLCRRHSDCSKA